MFHTTLFLSPQVTRTCQGGFRPHVSILCYKSLTSSCNFTLHPGFWFLLLFASPRLALGSASGRWWSPHSAIGCFQPRPCEPRFLPYRGTPPKFSRSWSSVSNSAFSSSASGVGLWFGEDLLWGALERCVAQRGPGPPLGMGYHPGGGAHSAYSNPTLFEWQPRWPPRSQVCCRCQPSPKPGTKRPILGCGFCSDLPSPQLQCTPQLFQPPFLKHQLSWT